MTSHRNDGCRLRSFTEMVDITFAASVTFAVPPSQLQSLYEAKAVSRNCILTCQPPKAA
jgi:hypothetical protein